VGADRGQRQIVRRIEQLGKRDAWDLGQPRFAAAEQRFLAVSVWLLRQGSGDLPDQQISRKKKKRGVIGPKKADCITERAVGRGKTNRSLSRQPSADQKNRTTKRRSPMSQSKSFRPSLESLEAREVPAHFTGSGFNLNQATGVLTVTGFAEYASHPRYVTTVRMVNNEVVVTRGLPANKATLGLSEVTKIVYQGGTSAETFTNHTRIPSEFSDRGPTDRYETPFKLEGPSRLPNDSASGQTEIDGKKVGSNIPPPITWKDPPHGTASFTLTMVDIDAGSDYPNGYTHMVLNINSAEARSIDQALVRGATYGVNGRGRNEYYGPNPPAELTQPLVSETHRYVFTLTAYDASGTVLGTTVFTSEFGYASGVRTDSGVNN
jgi:phosphatidylethanolamine-binding protein (PEBP) family uncharacterized protein